MPTLGAVAMILLVPTAVVFAVFYLLILANNILGERFERSLHAKPFGRHPV